jgi:transposase
MAGLLQRRDLYEDTDGLGGANHLSEGQRQLARRAAMLSSESERQEALAENTHRSASAHPDGVAARERNDAAFDCRGAMGVSLSTVNRAHMAYDHGGLEALKPRPSGGRKRENMTLEDEKALLARFAKAAGAGEMLNIHDLKAAYEKAIGHETSKSTIYNLLARHGWRKLMPRPFHPRRDMAAQNAFKKMAFQML